MPGLSLLMLFCLHEDESSFLGEMFYFKVVSSYINKKQYFYLELTKSKEAKIIAMVSSHNLLENSARVYTAAADEAFEYYLEQQPSVPDICLC
jgi:hypothetical protein